MTCFQDLIIEPLGVHHDKQCFACGVETLDTYFMKQAKQDVNRRIARVFVAISADKPSMALGYYTLSTLSLALTELPISLAKKLPKHPIPAALIGRLACSKVAQGHGVDKMLLMDAIKRTISVCGQIAIYAVVVDAKDEQTMAFYARYGFSRISEDSLRLFLPLKSFN